MVVDAGFALTFWPRSGRHIVLNLFIVLMWLPALALPISGYCPNRSPIMPTLFGVENGTKSPIIFTKSSCTCRATILGQDIHHAASLVNHHLRSLEWHTMEVILTSLLFSMPSSRPRYYFLTKLSPFISLSPQQQTRPPNGSEGISQVTMIQNGGSWSLRYSAPFPQHRR